MKKYIRTSKVVAADDASTDGYADQLKEAVQHAEADFEYAIQGIEFMGRQNNAAISRALVIVEELSDHIKDILAKVADEVDGSDSTAAEASRKISASDDEFAKRDKELVRLERKLKAEVLEKLKNAGIDTDDEETQFYADGAVELIMQDDAHDVDYWWKETLANYKNEIDELPHVDE